MKKDVFLANVKNGSEIKTSLMVMRVIFRDTTKVVCILADKTGEIKATIQNKQEILLRARLLK